MLTLTLFFFFFFSLFSISTSLPSDALATQTPACWTQCLLTTQPADCKSPTLLCTSQSICIPQCHCTNEATTTALLACARTACGNDPDINTTPLLASIESLCSPAASKPLATTTLTVRVTPSPMPFLPPGLMAPASLATPAVVVPYTSGSGSRSTGGRATMETGNWRANATATGVVASSSVRASGTGSATTGGSGSGSGFFVDEDSLGVRTMVDLCWGWLGLGVLVGVVGCGVLGG
ncbi:hypothetical protein EJ05DRAFT_507512 [Pseudovirgaria hyperparasitica]|uniref:Extracellular membrane protein CFEM domain-containing protein n=1 Tax=Pseudovirgaria hyperparasitica TaxID=470096 RepID=A0A6A6WJE4_9PEZI|nr:uncharacterized protein EJ05DRAFT_507512 [Pseudovirgaria hyperparasitica]KAF2761897.1 hypothetical protein EJ05DRAFT_507512 [Pseudovirgaria hyperparasitica]